MGEVDGDILVKGTLRHFSNHAEMCVCVCGGGGAVLPAEITASLSPKNLTNDRNLLKA